VKRRFTTAFVAPFIAALLATTSVLAASTCPTFTALTGTGSISSSTLTIAASPVPTGTWGSGVCFQGTGVIPNTCITADGTGSGGAGTYTVNSPQTAASTALTAANTVKTSVLNFYAAASGVNDAGNTCTSATYPCSFPNAVEKAAQQYLSFVNPTVNLAAGIYAAGVGVAGAMVQGIGSYSGNYITITGPSVTPPTAIINDSSGATAAIIASDHVKVLLQYLDITSNSGSLIFPTKHAEISSGDNMVYGKSVDGQLHAEQGGVISLYCGYTIDGSAGGTIAPSHYQAVLGGMIIADENSGMTVTLSGTPKFAGGANTGFADIESNSTLYVPNSDWTYAGAANAITVKYYTATGGGIETNGAAVTYLPGTVAGAANSPGWYH
jgi:hypothetical protein